MSDYTKHTMHTDALDFLGSVLTDSDAPGRDAVHMAVFRAEAGNLLYPGDHVLLQNGLAFGATRGSEAAVGIVDPFVLHPVRVGDEFYIMLNPRTITSLQHVWAHPSFPASDAHRDAALDAFMVADAAAAASEAWLRKFCDDLDASTYGEGTVFDRVIEAAQHDPSYVRVGFDCYGEIPTEFWHHLSIYTGVDYTSNPGNSEYFSCAC